MEKIVVELDVKSNKGVKEVEKLNKEISNTSKESADASKSLDGFTGGAVSKFKGLKGSIGSVVKGFKSLKFAILASGIGALLIAIVAVGKAFTSSEEGQDKFAKLMGVIGVVTGNVIDIFADLGNSLFSLGKALFKLASGDLAGASKAFGEAKDSINDVTEAVVNFGEETKKEIGIINDLSNQRAKADRLERKLIVERAEANRKRAELLDKSVQKELFTAAQRIEFLKEAGRIEDEITAKEIVAAKIRFDTKVAENSLSKSTKEDLVEEANLQANLINLETAKLAKQKAVSAQILTAKREEAAELKEIQDEESARILEAQKIIDEKDAVAKKALEEAEVLRLVKLKETKDEEDRIAKESADLQIELERKKTEAKQIALNTLVALFGAESKMGRAALVAKQLMAAQELLIDLGAIKSKATKAIVGSQLNAAESGGAIATGFSKTLALGFPAAIPALIGYVAAAGGIVSGVMAATKKTKSVASSVGGAGGGSVSAPSIPSAPSLPPAFNIVGQSDTNQLADAIGGQSKIPQRSFVVASDVTSAQSMDRNIVEGASI